MSGKKSPDLPPSDFFNPEKYALGGGGGGGGGGRAAKSAAPLPGDPSDDDAASTGDDTRSVVSRATTRRFDTDRDDAASVAAAGAQVLGSEWDAIDDGDVADALYTWPPDRVTALQTALKAAPWHDTSYKMQSFKNAMTGEEISDWLQQNNFAKSVEDVQKVGTAMLARGMFHQLNKKKKLAGFVVDASFKYTLKEEKVKDNIIARLAGGERTNVNKAIAGAQVGVRYDRGDTLVVAFVEQRVRRPNKDEVFDGEHLTALDPPEYSMPLDEVPVPAVGDAPPDQCEWVLGWEVVVTEETDAAGWRYGIDFKEGSAWEKDLATSHLIRKREWRRPARKHVEKKPPKKEVGGEEVGERKTEEEQQKEMLAKAAQVRVPRSGFLELTVSFGRDLLRICDSIVTIDYRDVHEKSEVSKKADQHLWNFKTFINVPNDMEPIKVAVWQVGTLKKQFLGETDVFIPEFTTRGEPRTHPLQPRQVETDAEVRRMSETLGSIMIDWTFTVDELAKADTTGTKQEAASGGRRVICDMYVREGDGITLNRKRIGPCGGLSFKRSKPKVFIRANYRGEFSDMISESPRVLLNNGKPEFRWHASLPLVPTVPLRLEVFSDDGSLIGETKFTHQPGEARGTEFEGEFILTKPEPPAGSPVAASAEVLLGKLMLKWRWLVEQDPFAALNEAAASEAARRRQQERDQLEREEKEGKPKKDDDKDDDKKDDDKKEDKKTSEDSDKKRETESKPPADQQAPANNDSSQSPLKTSKERVAEMLGDDTPLVIPKQFQDKDLLAHW